MPYNDVHIEMIPRPVWYAFVVTGLSRKFYMNMVVFYVCEKKDGNRRGRRAL